MRRCFVGAGRTGSCAPGASIPRTGAFKAVPCISVAVAGTSVSVTAGTILDSTKLALRTWFLAMYLLTQTKNGISGLELSRQLGVSYNTAWSLKHKLMQVMKERDDTRPLGGWVQLDDAYWGGERRGGKRGRGAPGKTPFVAAVEINREGRPVSMRLSRVGAFQSDEIAAWAKCHLEPGTLVFCDALSCFSAVQRAGCFHQPFVTGGGPDSAQHPALSWAGPNFVGCKNEFVIRRILAVCESSGMSASWGKREERIFPFRGGVQGGSRRVGARRGRTGALARWCPDARPGWGGRRLSVWLVRGALARRRGGVWRSADGLGGGTRSAL